MLVNQRRYAKHWTRLMIEIDDLMFDRLSIEHPIDVVKDVSEVRDFVPAMLGWVRRQRMEHGNLHFALTAPEIGLNKMLMVTDGHEDYPRVLINPVVVDYSLVVKEERHEHVSIHAFNLKWEQYLLSTSEGYYVGRERCGIAMAKAVHDAYRILMSYPH